MSVRVILWVTSMVDTDSRCGAQLLWGVAGAEGVKCVCVGVKCVCVSVCVCVCVQYPGWLGACGAY
jgi:hypothetical protein